MRGSSLRKGSNRYQPRKLRARPLRRCSAWFQRFRRRRLQKAGTGSGAFRFVLAGETAQRGLVAAIAQPVADLSEPDALVKAARRVPVEHLEVDAAPAALDRDRGQPRHQPAADPVPARALNDEQIFEIQPGPAEPGRKARMKNRAPRRFAAEKGEDRLELALGAEAVATQIRLGRDDCVRRPLEDGNSLDQAKQQRTI